MNTRIVLWAARITGTLLLLFLLFMLVGHLTGDANGPEGMRFRDTREFIGFLLFPVCTIIGLALAYRWPTTGALIAVGSMVALFALRPDLLQPRFLAMLVPGLLYLVYGHLCRGAKH